MLCLGKANVLKKVKKQIQGFFAVLCSAGFLKTRHSKPRNRLIFSLFLCFFKCSGLVFKVAFISDETFKKNTRNAFGFKNISIFNVRKMFLVVLVFLIKIN